METNISVGLGNDAGLPSVRIKSFLQCTCYPGITGFNEGQIVLSLNCLSLEGQECSAL